MGDDFPPSRFGKDAVDAWNRFFSSLCAGSNTSCSFDIVRHRAAPSHISFVVVCVENVRVVLLALVLVVVLFTVGLLYF